MVSFPENTNGLEGSVTRIISLNTRAKVGDDSFTSSTTGLIKHMSKLNVGSSEVLPDNVTKFRQCVEVFRVDKVLRARFNKDSALILSAPKHHNAIHGCGQTDCTLLRYRDDLLPYNRCMFR